MDALAGRSYLVVDDEEISRLLVSRFLRQVEPRQLLLAAHGQEALDLLASNPVDCLVTDLNMRPVDGLELLKAVRTGASAARRDLPVVLFAGRSDIDRMGIALALDVHAFVVKPVARPVLLERIRRGLAQPTPAVPVEAYRAIELTPAPGAGPAPPAGGAGPDRQTPLNEVRDGQVLSRAVASHDGRRLVDAGTALTRRWIDRLTDLVELDPSLAQVWIRL
jgi:CheY-like chemotaxis protein